MQKIDISDLYRTQICDDEDDFLEHPSTNLEEQEVPNAHEVLELPTSSDSGNHVPETDEDNEVISEPRFLRDHPLTNVVGHLEDGVRTRSYFQTVINEDLLALISQI